MLKYVMLFFLVPAAIAQSTSVTATITDSDGQTWNNGTYTMRLMTSGPNPTWNGSPIPTSIFTGSLNGSGTFTVSVPDNSYIAPSGSYYNFTICPNATSGCFTAQIAVSGSSQNLSTTLSASAKGPRFPAVNGAYGYLDIEISPIPLPGGIYYNVTNQIQRIWDGAAWTDGGSGGGAVSSVTNTDGTLTISPTTGEVVASLNLAHANTWTASQTFNAGIAMPSTQSLSWNGDTGITRGSSARQFYFGDAAGSQNGNLVATTYASDSLVQVNGSGMYLPLSGGVFFSSTSTYTGTKDVGIDRSAAGVIEINSGSPGNANGSLALNNLTVNGTCTGCGADWDNQVLTDASPIALTVTKKSTYASVTLSSATATRAINITGLAVDDVVILKLLQDPAGSGNALLTGGTGCSWTVNNPNGHGHTASTDLTTAANVAAVGDANYITIFYNPDGECVANVD